MRTHRLFDLFFILIIISPATSQDNFNLGYLGEEYTDTVMLCSDVTPYDCLAAYSVSWKFGIPLMHIHKNSIPPSVENALVELNPARIILVGGPSVISQDVEMRLKKKVDVIRIWGITRYTTAINLARIFWNTSNVVVAIDESHAENLALATGFAGYPFIYTGATPPTVVYEGLRDLGARDLIVIGSHHIPGYGELLPHIKYVEALFIVSDHRVAESICSIASPPARWFLLPQSRINDFSYLFDNVDINIIGDYNEINEINSEIIDIIGEHLFVGKHASMKIRREVVDDFTSFCALQVIQERNKWAYVQRKMMNRDIYDRLSRWSEHEKELRSWWINASDNDRWTAYVQETALFMCNPLIADMIHTIIRDMDRSNCSCIQPFREQLELLSARYLT